MTVSDDMIIAVRIFNNRWSTPSFAESLTWSADFAMQVVMDEAIGLTAIADATPNCDGSFAEQVVAGIANAFDTRSAKESPQEFCRLCLYEVKNNFPELF